MSLGAVDFKTLFMLPPGEYILTQKWLLKHFILYENRDETTHEFMFVQVQLIVSVSGYFQTESPNCTLKLMLNNWVSFIVFGV